MVGVERQRPFGDKVAPVLAATELHPGDIFYLVGPADAVGAAVATAERLTHLPVEDNQRQYLIKER